MQGKLIAVVYALRTYSLFAEFVNKNGWISVLLVSLIIHIIVSYDQNISSIFFVTYGSHVRLQHPACVYITTQRQYTAVQKIK